MHTIKTKTPYIGPDEVLQIIVRHNGETYIEESEFLARTYTADSDVLPFLNDEVQRVIRFDLQSLTGEDITEELAQAYLDGQQPYSWDESTLPDYVKKSQAWEDHCSDHGIAA